MKTSAQILIVDDEPDIRSLVGEILTDEGYAVTTAEHADEARRARSEQAFDLALLDIWMPDVDGISLLREWSLDGQLPFPVIMMSGHGSIETAVEATKLGAYDFIEKPISLAKLLLTVERALEAGRLRRENEGLRQNLPQIVKPVGSSPAMNELRAAVERAARHETPVLISGEAGVGKASVARYLHALSSRADRPFISVPCTTQRDPDLSEQGEWLRRAQRGVLFLDEVAALGHDSQMQLSHTLEGSQDFRIVAATRQDIEAEVRAGRFAERLYYQLNVVPLHIPALRERPEDVPELLRYYAEFFSAREGLSYRRFAVAAQNRLRNHSWPGNVRELRNLVQRLLILGTDDVEVEEVEQALSGTLTQGSDSIGGAEIDLSLPLREAREQFERAYLRRQLQAVDGSVAQLARVSGMERTHLYRKLRALGVDPKKPEP